MASRQSQKRLNKEYKSIQANPPPFIIAKPNDENILEWHYIINGPDSTPFENGQYHGMLRFPSEYPFKPPSITMITPNGRFACNTRLCLSMSDYHPDTWNPAWSVATILTGLLSFMTGDESTTGSIVTSDTVKRRLAQESKSWNLKNPRFLRIFPDLIEKNKLDIETQSKLNISSNSLNLDDEKPLSITNENIHLLDPEDRARLMLEKDGEVVVPHFSGITMVGVAVAAFIAAYFTLFKRS
jgi:ubiquitin-conjugating enzyme E2 J2